MASRHVILIISLWLTVLSCFPGCDWSDTESTEPQTVQISTPPDAAKATIFLGSSSKTVTINGEDGDLYITPAEDELGKHNRLLVEFTDSNDKALPGSEVIREVYIGKSGQTSINLRFDPITWPYIRVSLAEGEIGIKINVKGWNFQPNENVKIYLDIEHPGAQPNTQTNSPKKASWASIRLQSKVEYRKAPGTTRNGADESVHSVNAKEDGSFEATFAVPSGLISDVLAREASVRVKGEMSGSGAQAPFAITDPYIYLDPATAAERAEIAVTGLNFGANEGIQIKLGDAEIASARTDEKGYFKSAFRVPEGTPVEKTSVHVLGLNSRSEQTVTFTVSTGSIQVRPLTFGGGVVGKKITLKGSKFAANENVIIYLGDVKIAEATTDENGDFKATFVFPQLEASEEEELEFVRARGEKSGCEATTPFMVLPDYEDVAEIRILPDEGFAGAGMTAEGFFFGEEEIVVIYLGDEEVARTQTDEWGYFKAVFTVPSHVSVGEYIYAEAVGEESGYEAEEGFYITVREPKIHIFPDEGFAGAEMIAEGYFFGEEEIVVIYLDNREAARTQTDEWGYFKTVFTVPSDASVWETISIKAIGRKSDYEAETEFTIRGPEIDVSSYEGAAGAAIRVHSWDFGEKENVVIYLDDREVARTQTDERGYFEVTFRIPGDTPIGETTIEAIGEKSGSIAKTEFAVLVTYIYVYPSEGSTGTEVNVYSYDFVADENVFIYLGDKEVARTQTDRWGYCAVTFRVPEDTPIGETIVRAIGEKSGSKAETKFTVRAYIYVSPSENSIGAEIRVYSYSFGKEENVVIYLGDKEVARTQTDGSGYFSVTFRIPGDTPVGETIIKAMGEKSGNEAETKFTVLRLYIYVSPSEGSTGAEVRVNSYNFGEEENVVIYLGDKEVARTQTDGWGYFEVTFAIPVDTPLGETIVRAIGDKSGSKAETKFTVREPEIHVYPDVGFTGSQMIVYVYLFGEEENVDVYLGDQVVGRAPTDKQGYFRWIFRVPEGVSVGETVVKAIGEKSGRKAEAEFTVVPTPVHVEPAEAAIGEVITVSGWGFGAEKEIKIDFGDIKGIIQTTTDENGHFETDFEVPEGVQPGVTFIRVEGLESGTIVKAVFTVKP